MRRLLAAAGLGATIAWLALPGSPALACTCEQLAAPAQLAGADAVFAGRVVQIVTGDDHIDVAVRVERVYKGSPPADIHVRTPATQAGCGLQFARESEYLMFARVSGGAYSTSLCAGTTDDIGMLDRAGYPSHEIVTATAAPRRGSVHIPVSRTAPIAGAAVALAGVFVMHARRFARS